jgi:DNA (cytosine-5)-methyltransferase 1
MSNLVAIDLFCGAGGLSEGLTQAGFNVAFASDIHKTYVETYRYNHPNTVVYTDDIRNLTNAQVLDLCKVEPGELDLLAGGPPCQGFSINAPVRTMTDLRNHLFVEFLRIAETLSPKFVVIENVPGIVSLEKGAVVKDIYSSLRGIGYRTNHMILYAAHYGVPQMRWRTFFIASKLQGIKSRFPPPTHYAKGFPNFTGGNSLCFRTESKDSLFGPRLLDHTTVWDAISDLTAITNGGGADEMPYMTGPISEYQALLRSNSSALYNHKAPRLGSINLERLKYIPQGGSWRDIPYELLPAGLKRARRSDHTRRYGRLDPDGLCSTILTKCDPHWGSFFHPTQERTLTVREAARIQSFPDCFRFLGSLTEQYEQVGNAVPPLLAKAIGTIIIRQIISTQSSRRLKAV